MAPSTKGSHWSFTLNFSGEVPELSHIFPANKVQYAIWQHEKVDHDHIQGYIQFHSFNTSMKQIREIFDPFHPHLKKVTVNCEGRKPWEYASKEETRVAGPWEYGIRIERGSNKRSKLLACERSPERMEIEETDLFRMYQSQKYMKQFHEEFKPPAWDRKWQAQVNDLIKKAPNGRDVIWVYGPAGNEGKTTFAKGLIQRGWAYIDPSKYADMFEMYHQQGTTKNVVLDFHRSCDLKAFYAFIEKVKNRVIPKLKYRSSMHIHVNDIHVVVMSNYPPDETMLSKDRFVMVEASTELVGSKKRKLHISEKLPREDPHGGIFPSTYMGQTIDPDVHLRDLPNGRWVCYQDGEFEYIVIPDGPSEDKIRRIVMSDHIRSLYIGIQDGEDVVVPRDD